MSDAYGYEDLLTLAEGVLKGVKFPGRLPKPPMLMFDRLTYVSKSGGKYGHGECKAELDIHPDLWFFKCHFVGDPVMPGCLGLDALWQLLGFYLSWSLVKKDQVSAGESELRGRALGVGNLKFSGQILETVSTVRYELQIKRVKLGKTSSFGFADGYVFADDVCVYEAEDLKAGLFSSVV